MKKYNWICKNLGTVKFNGSQIQREIDDSGFYANLFFNDAESAHKRLSKFDFVVRKNGKKIAGKDYTLAMCKNDFK